jgi:hypothetical protein
MSNAMGTTANALRVLICSIVIRAAVASSTFSVARKRAQLAAMERRRFSRDSASSQTFSRPGVPPLRTMAVSNSRRTSESFVSVLISMSRSRMLSGSGGGSPKISAAPSAIGLSASCP